MFLELAAAGFIIGQYIYHRWTDAHKDNVDRADEADIPITEEGQARPLVFGRIRVQRPILAWIDRPHAFAGEGALDGKTVYSMSMLFVIGAPFDSCNGTNKLHTIWSGDLKLFHRIFPSGGAGLPAGVPLEDLDGDGSVEDVNRHRALVETSVFADGDTSVALFGFVEFLNGKPTQLLVDATFPYNAQTRAAVQMTNFTGTSDTELQGEVDASLVPGYRGVLSVFLYNQIGSGGLHFRYGLSPQLGAFSFEISAYHTNHAQLGTYCQVGLDSNPINVIYDILTATQGKLGFSSSLIDIASFQEAQLTVHQESNGYSRVFDERMTAADMIDEVLRQIDGVLYEDQVSGLIKIKLVRGDFDPTTIPHITRANCEKLTGFAMGGRTNLINKIRVVYNNREKDYTDDSAVAQNLANAVGQDGQVVEEVIEYPGCCDTLLAARLAGRELAARSRPIIKCRAIVGRQFLRVNPGDAVKLTWTNPDVSGLIFRVAAVDRGTLEDGAIGLDLIQDVNFTWRNESPLPPDFGDSALGVDDIDAAP